MRYSELKEVKILKVYSNERHKRIPVVVNPSKKDFDIIMNKSKDGHLRAYLYDNNLYMWDAFYTYHIDLASALGIDDNKAMNLHFFKKGSAAWDAGESDDTDQYFIKNFPAIQRIVTTKTNID